jgi:hypothetical protein
MTEIRKSKQYLVMQGLGHAQRRRRVLNIGICDFRHKILRQNYLSLTPARWDWLSLISQDF